MWLLWSVGLVGSRVRRARDEQRLRVRETFDREDVLEGGRPPVRGKGVLGLRHGRPVDSFHAEAFQDGVNARGCVMSEPVAEDKVVRWRREQLEQAGYTKPQAVVLAEGRCDLHEAVELARAVIGAGHDVSIAFDISSDEVAA